ncbi:ribonuclease R [Kordiimonas aestuarii]|uniref:ribonuclease R n=1 Tax=Kordiimonas aestuarii TaxID=1005925 RepID=UPI0021CF7804|nr:ribonuclease R [Kordiimonas aestuarii]
MAKYEPGPLPTREEVLDFVRNFSGGKVTKRDIARAFGVKGPDKVFLKKLLRELTDDGVLTKDTGHALRPADRLPGVQVVEFAGLDKGGEALVKPVNYEGEGKPPHIILKQKKGKRPGPTMGAGDRALVRLTCVKDEPPVYRASILKILKPAPKSVMGVFHGGPNGGRVHPTDKKNRDEYWVDRDDVMGAEEGELVLAEPVKSNRQIGPKRVRIKERLGDVSDARSISMIAIHSLDIPYEFPPETLKAADAAKPVTLGKRTDLRDTPLITIDPSDARDHDDAIWAEADDDPSNDGGWHAIVAIADVAHYVPNGSALDREAIKRGNSCYFPDRVVPMLPEALSAGLCSLMPGEERACMAVHIWFDKDGKKLRHKFVRGLMKSAGNVSYERAQAALDGTPDDLTAPLLEPVLKPLYGTFRAIMKARAKRQPLELDMPERKIVLDEAGHVAGITIRDRFDAHRIVEELMITANVCAAEELEAHRVPAMYRVHEEPPMDKMESLRDFLGTLDLNLAKGSVMMPRLFNGILNQVKDSPHERLVNEVVLRSQTQAYYSPDNMGHFGLALPRYAHFTSPIRRYADLIVHRGLVRALKLGKDGLTDEQADELSAIGEQISSTERRAMAAERESTDRYLANYLADHVGDEFFGRITGVTRFGLFVSLEPSGGDGLIPISSIGMDFYTHDEAHHRLVGERSGEEFKLGDRIKVRLTEANRFTGGLKLDLIREENDIAGVTSRKQHKKLGARHNRTGGRPARGKKPARKSKKPG